MYVDRKLILNVVEERFGEHGRALARILFSRPPLPFITILRDLKIQADQRARLLFTKHLLLDMVQKGFVTTQNYGQYEDSCSVKAISEAMEREEEKAELTLHGDGLTPLDSSYLTSDRTIPGLRGRGATHLLSSSSGSDRANAGLGPDSDLSRIVIFSLNKDFACLYLAFPVLFPLMVDTALEHESDGAFGSRRDEEDEEDSEVDEDELKLEGPSLFRALPKGHCLPRVGALLVEEGEEEGLREGKEWVIVLVSILMQEGRMTRFELFNRCRRQQTQANGTATPLSHTTFQKYLQALLEDGVLTELVPTDVPPPPREEEEGKESKKKTKAKRGRPRKKKEEEEEEDEESKAVKGLPFFEEYNVLQVNEASLMETIRDGLVAFNRLWEESESGRRLASTSTRNTTAAHLRRVRRRLTGRYIKGRYDELSLRVVNCLLAYHYVEDGQISELIVHDRKLTRKLMYTLQGDQLIRCLPMSRKTEFDPKQTKYSYYTTDEILQTKVKEWIQRMILNLKEKAKQLRTMKMDQRELGNDVSVFTSQLRAMDVFIGRLAMDLLFFLC